MERMAKFSSDDFDQWAFAISRRRRVAHGKTLALHNAPHELVELRSTAEAMDFARFLR
jgi:hypothetical protein